MTISEFRAEICDELEGACNYIKRAIAIRMSYPAWAKRYAEMSAAELEHASNLYKMFEEYFENVIKDFSENQRAAMPWLSEARNEIVEMYTDKYHKVKTMHELFNK